MVIGLEQVLKEAQHTKRVLSWNPFRWLSQFVERRTLRQMESLYLKLQGLLSLVEEGNVLADAQDFQFLNSLEELMEHLATDNKTPNRIKYIVANQLPIIKQIKSGLVNVQELSATEILNAMPSNRAHLVQQIQEADQLKKTLSL